MSKDKASYMLRIYPDDVSPGPNPRPCTARIYKTVEVLSFPVEASGANDHKASVEARKRAARELGIEPREIGW